MNRKVIIILIATFLSVISSAQNMKINGVVTDSANIPVIGATVIADGTGTGTSTDANGEFEISAPRNGTLTFSIIGFATQTVPIDGRIHIPVQLKEDTEFLDATIVVEYGSGQKISNIVGSVETVSSDELASRPSANIGDALQGKVAEEDRESLGVSSCEIGPEGRLHITCTCVGCGKLTVKAIAGGNAQGTAEQPGGMVVSRTISIVSRHNVSTNGGWL